MVTFYYPWVKHIRDFFLNNATVPWTLSIYMINNSIILKKKPASVSKVSFIVSFCTIIFFTKNLRSKAFQAMQTSEIISIFMYFTRTCIKRMTCTLWSIRLISVSVYLLRPSSQQGQGTFRLIYSKGRLSFNFLHIHKRVSHPRSHFPFQP